MAPKFELVPNKEEDIFIRLEDDLFWGYIHAGQLESLEGIIPASELDRNVFNAVERALNILIPKPIDATIAYRRIQR